MKNNKLFTNIMYNGFFQVFNMIIPLVTLPYISRVFNPDLIGRYSYTLAVVQLFVLVGNFGILNYGSRSIAIANSDAQRQKVFNEVWLLQLLMTLISFVFLLGIIQFLPYKEQFYLQALLVIANGFEISWYFIGIENFKKVTIRNVLVKTLITASIFLFVKDSTQLNLYILINVFAALLSNLYMIKYVRKYINFKSIELSSFKLHIRPAFALLLPQLITLVYTTLDKSILGTLSTTEQVGFYDQSQKIVRVSIALVTSVSTVLMPRITSLLAQGKISEFRTMLLTAFHITNLTSFYIVSVLIVVAQSFVSWFYGSDFLTVGPLMMFISVIGIIIPVTVLMANTVLIPFKKEKYIITTAIYAAIASFSINFLLDGNLGALGACIALIVAEGIAFFMRTYYAQKVIEFKLFDKQIVQIIVASIISVLVGLVAVNFVTDTFIATIMGVLVVTIVYFSTLIVLKNKLIWKSIIKIRKEMK